MDRFDALRGPGADGVIAPGQPVGVVGVQALDPRAGPSDAAPPLRAVQLPAPLGRVRSVRRFERGVERLVVMHAFVQLTDRAARLHARHGPHGVRAREPVARGERVAVDVERAVADHERVTAGASRDDGERRRGLATELRANGGQIARAELVHGVGQRRLCSVARFASTCRSSLLRMNFFSIDSNSGFEPRR